jgi:hypothetical protein
VSTKHLPIVCAWCGRVRRSTGRWEATDTAELDAAEATHGICPDCLETEQFAAILAVECR